MTGQEVHWYLRRRQHLLGLYSRWVAEIVIPSFDNLDRRATEVVNEEYSRILSRPIGEDYGDVDFANAAESATEAGQAWYNEQTTIRQIALNLHTIGLFHLVEQILKDLIHDLTDDQNFWNSWEQPQPPQKLREFGDLEKWFRKECQI